MSPGNPEPAGGAASALAQAAMLNVTIRVFI
jgi:hypothetical protein